MKVSLVRPLGKTEEQVQKQEIVEWGALVYCLLQTILGSSMVHIGRSNL